MNWQTTRRWSVHAGDSEISMLLLSRGHYGFRGTDYEGGAECQMVTFVTSKECSSRESFPASQWMVLLRVRHCITFQKRHKRYQTDLCQKGDHLHPSPHSNTTHPFTYRLVQLIEWSSVNGASKLAFSEDKAIRISSQGTLSGHLMNKLNHISPIPCDF